MNKLRHDVSSMEAALKVEQKVSLWARPEADLESAGGAVVVPAGGAKKSLARSSSGIKGRSGSSYQFCFSSSCTSATKCGDIKFYRSSSNSGISVVFITILIGLP